MQQLKTLALAAAVLVTATLLACGGNGGYNDGASPSPASPTPSQANNERGLFPPLEGPERPVAREVINYWEDHDFDLPDPAGLPDLPSDLSSLAPPDVPVCPEGWINLDRPTEAFKVCYPDGYATEGHGYVTAGVDERWYGVGIFDFEEGDVELGHVSIYVTGPFSRPFDYVAQCDQAYGVTIDGEPAAVCPDYAGVGDEKIIAYHLRVGDYDYSINAVPAQDASASSGAAGEIEDTLLQIVHSFELIDQIPIVRPSPSTQATGQ